MIRETGISMYHNCTTSNIDFTVSLCILRVSMRSIQCDEDRCLCFVCVMKTAVCVSCVCDEDRCLFFVCVMKSAVCVSCV